MAKIIIEFDDNSRKEYVITDKIALSIDCVVNDTIKTNDEEISIIIDQSCTNSCLIEDELEISIEDASSSGYENPENVAEVKNIKKKTKEENK